MLTLAVSLLFSAPQDWVYKSDLGFVDLDTMQRRSPAEFFKHGEQLRQAGRPEEAAQVFTLIREHVPDLALREAAHFEAAETWFKAASFDNAYREYETFVVRYPQSDRATQAKRMELSSALALARAGRSTGVFGLSIASSSKPGIEFLKASLRRYPREEFTADFIQRLGKFHFERGDWDAAADQFQLILDQYADAPDAVLALWMLGVTSEARFSSVEYDIKPLKDARRHYERFLEEAEKMRRLPEPARRWVDEIQGSVEKRLERVYDLMLEKARRTVKYYEWKGLPKAALLYHKAILKDLVSYRRVLPQFPRREAEADARAALQAAGVPLPAVSPARPDEGKK